MKPALCMCALLPHIATKTRVVVVLHALEQRKSTNTGQLAQRCLDNSEIVMFGRADGKLADKPWPAGKTPIVLFPVAGAQPVDDFAGRDDIALIALDANWRQAARLRKRFAIHNVPFVRAPAGPSTYTLRKGPHDDGMSTLEAIVRSLVVLDGIDAAPLLRAFEVFQDRLLWLRGSKNKDAVAGGIPDGVLRHLA